MIRIVAPLLLVALVVSAFAMPTFAADATVSTLAEKYVATSIADRRWLHQHPELSGQEHATSAYVAAQVDRLEHVQQVPGDWGLGLVYVMEGSGSGPTILWRADMDALPMSEETGLPYASTVIATTEAGRETGVMHACGHDIHMSVALGVMRVMHDLRGQFPGRLVFVFQPAEEIGVGARDLIEAGVLEGDLEPDRVFALHDHPTLLAGQAGVCSGPSTANVDGFKLTVLGHGGHGAYPYRTVDPVSLAARMVLAINDVVAREVDPNHPAVVSFGSIHGGHKSNVIPERVELLATVRTRDPSTRELIRAKIERTVSGLAAAAGAPEPVVDYYLGTPAGFNDPELSRQILDVMTRVLGPDAALDYPPGMGGEDFGRFSSQKPGVQFRLGVGRRDREMSLHSPAFDPDEESIAVGIRLVAEILLDQLNR